MEMVKIYSGSEIMALKVQNQLEEAGVNTIIRNNIDSGARVGISPIGQTVDVYVNEEDAAKATGIIGT